MCPHGRRLATSLVQHGGGPVTQLHKELLGVGSYLGRQMAGAFLVSESGCDGSVAGGLLGGVFDSRCHYLMSSYVLLPVKCSIF